MKKLFNDKVKTLLKNFQQFTSIDVWPVGGCVLSIRFCSENMTAAVKRNAFWDTEMRPPKKSSGRSAHLECRSSAGELEQ